MKSAADLDRTGGETKRAKAWHESEKFLKAATSSYRRNSVQMVTFPPNSGDLNPIETVWTWLRRDLGKRELADLKAKRPALTEHQFKQRCAQILFSYAPDTE